MSSPVRAVGLLPQTDEQPASPRSAGLSRARRVQELRRGNARSLRHGIRATLLNQLDADVEVALIFAGRPGLDPIRDGRLVEELAISLIRRARVQLAMDAEGHTPTLTAYDSKLLGVTERLERAVHERERERLTDKRRGDGAGLGRYRSEGTSS